MPEPEDARRYWLKPGAVPAGPYTPAEVYARLAAGAVTWDTPARASGETAWKPLSAVPGIAPVDGPAPPPAPASGLAVSLPVPTPALPAPPTPAAVPSAPARPASPATPAGDRAGR